MLRRFPAWFLLAGLAAAPLAAVRAETPDAKATQAAIAGLLHDFLAYNADPARHDRFWADDLVYTSSAAAVKSKADILQGFAAPKPADPKTAPAAAYSAEDVLVRPYGTTAALTFRLVARDPDGKVLTYRNSGTFLYRDGEWRAVTWQATKESP